MYYYKAFGLAIASEERLPRLAENERCEYDVSIERKSVAKNGLSSPNLTKLYAQFSKNEVWLHIPNVAYFYITDGNHISFEPYNDADMQSVCLYLLGSCIGAILHQRNQLVIHGNAIVIDGKAIIVAGPSGIGKSTLAAAFHARGYQILADDLAVINEHNEVLPSYPQIKLWEDSADKLKINHEQLDRIRLQVRKYEYPILEGYCDQPVPVIAVFILHSHNKDNFEVEHVKGLEKYTPLKNNTYRTGYIEGMNVAPQFFARCGQFANSIELAHITRPNVGFKLDELVDFILQQVNKPTMQQVG